MPKGIVNVTPFNELDKKGKLQARKKAYKQWSMNPDNYNTKQKMSILAKNIGMSTDQLISYKEKDKWLERYEKEKPKVKQRTKEMTEKTLEKSNIEHKKKVSKDIEEILDSVDIPEKWKLFIMHYLHSYNPMTAAFKAGYGTKSKSVPFTILNDERVKDTIAQIKEVMATDLNFTTHDLLSEYIKIAQADMTDFVEFDGRRVKLKDSTQVDGRLITEVRQGKDGVTIKLVDKKWAMDKLEKLFNAIEDRRLTLEEKKFELNKKLIEKQLGDTTGENKVIIINDL